MPTARKHIDKIIEKITNFHPVDDLSIPEEFILEKMNDVRATLIRQSYHKNDSLDSYYTHSCCHEIKCLKTSCVINGVTFKADGALHYIDKPNIVEGLGKKAINFLGDEDGRDYSQVSLKAFNLTKYLDSASSLPVYTIVGDKIWINNPTTSGKLLACMNKIAYNPVNDCVENYDVEYAVPSEYNLELLVMKDIFSSLGIHTDVSSNESDDRIISSNDYLRQQQMAQSQKQQQQTKD